MDSRFGDKNDLPQNKSRATRSTFSPKVIVLITSIAFCKFDDVIFVSWLLCVRSQDVLASRRGHKFAGYHRGGTFICFLSKLMYTLPVMAAVDRPRVGKPLKVCEGYPLSNGSKSQAPERPGPGSRGVLSCRIYLQDVVLYVLCNPFCYPAI